MAKTLSIRVVAGWILVLAGAATAGAPSEYLSYWLMAGMIAMAIGFCLLLYDWRTKRHP